LGQKEKKKRTFVEEGTSKYLGGGKNKETTRVRRRGGPKGVKTESGKEGHLLVGLEAFSSVESLG